MEQQVPQWLMAAVDAAGMTAYADDIVTISMKNGAPDVASGFPTDGPDVLLH